MNEYYGWAIDTQSKEGHGLIGRYWWFDEEYTPIPAHMEGHPIALFCTRRAARNVLSKTRGTFPRSKVIKVRITIERSK